MNEATRKYILDHRTEDVRTLALRKVSDPAVDHSFALDQIRGWQIANKKIPTWANVEDIHYPPHPDPERSARIAEEYAEKEKEIERRYEDWGELSGEA